MPFNLNPLDMILKLEYTKMDVYQTSQSLALECYKGTRNFPPDERYSMVQQLRRAALSVHLNLAEGCCRKSTTERKRFFEISRGSIIEIDACLDLAEELKYISLVHVQKLGEAVVRTFQRLSKMVR